MIEYRPWSRKTLEQSLDSYKNGDLSILDIQLGGGCNFSCIYCDSPDRKTIAFNRISILEKLGQETEFSWVFICGLGEPLYKSNKIELKQIAKYCMDRNIGVSMFSNVSLLDDDIIGLVRDNHLNIIFKLDSLSPDRIAYLYGTSSPDLHLRNVNELVSNAVVYDESTNLAASIVVTNENINELPDLLDYCDKHHIYPLVAGLEKCGKGINSYECLNPSLDALTDTRSLLNKRYGVKYSMPICPSVIAGIHVSANGDILLDQKTGLSCHWFWLDEPIIHMCGDVLGSLSYKDIRNNIFAYRDQQFESAKALLRQDVALPIGGCGGDIVELLTLFIEHHRPNQSILSNR